MKVSIITIVYNNKNSIEDTINSVLNQDYDDIEYIVIDGNSNDGTNEIVEKYLDKISYYKSEQDNGLYSALNKGVLAATGDVVGILHSDDLFYSNTTVSEFVNTFENYNADLVYADGLYVERNNIKKIKRVYKGTEYYNTNINFGWIPLHTTIFVKREVYKTHGLYSEKYHIAGDYDVSLRWFKDQSLTKVYIKKATVLMRLGGKSTNAKLQKRKSKEDLEIIRKHELMGGLTLLCKIIRKIPQYLKPRLKNYKL